MHDIDQTLPIQAKAPSVANSRRRALAAIGAAAFWGGISPAMAKEIINDCEKWAPGRKFLSGKSCQEKVQVLC